MTPYTIPSKTTRKFTLDEGNYGFKATAPRVIPLEGQKLFEKSYAGAAACIVCYCSFIDDDVD